MSYALLTSQVICPVDDMEDALEMAERIDRWARSNALAVIEREGVTEAEAHATGLRMLGTQVAVFDDLPTA